MFVAKSKLKIIPLGGLNEIGKNMTVFAYGNDMIIVDCGMAFPDEEMFGIDIVIPDFSFVVKNSDKVRGVVLTHGHEDHIGGLAYLLKEIDVPIFGTNLTIGLVQNKLKEHNLLSSTRLNRVMPGDAVNMGPFRIEFIHTNHSIPDAVALAIHTPVGTVLHTGDFKIDTTPIQGSMIDLARIGELGKRGVLALMSDSTNAERPGFTRSERIVGSTLENVFKSTKSRIIVATFASNVHRIQQIINAAVNNNRKVAVSGRSMLNLLEVATELGYMKIPANALIDIDDIRKYKPHQLTIITTGSQGEPMSALYRMAYSEHKKLEIVKGDLVVISANPIPGNEKLVANVVNELYKKGAEVYNDPDTIHVSGHACQEELKMILGLAKPKYFIPVHGEYKHLKTHADLGAQMGIKESNIFILDIGKVLELSRDSARCTETVQAGLVMVDGLGVGDVGNIVLRDRKHLAEDGLIVVVVTISSETGLVLAGPDVISRGFVYVRESESLMDDIRTIAKNALDNCEKNNLKDWTSLKNGIKSRISEYLYRETKRKPMILPVIMEI
ncbi:MAG: ribonuclease J [Ruminococcaceae bacterium]|nr:ribonuclease J [Oscillospiraceae bacterium]